MPEIGIRELKSQASEIVRAVREQRAEYIVTLRGKPVAMIVPFEEPHPGGPEQSLDEFWAEMDALAEEMDEATGGKSALQQLFEDRAAS